MIFISSHPSFNDTIDSLKFEFKESDDNSVLICGGRDFSNSGKTVNDFRQQFKNRKIIAFNQEPLNAKQKIFLSPNYKQFLLNADEVWDYDERNIEIIKQFRPDVKMHLLKPYKDWTVYKPIKKDIDILFYGTPNEHRLTLLKNLNKKYRVIALYHVYDLDQYILRSKILLNIHYFYECAMQEQARMIRWIGAPCWIISEKSWKNYLNVEEKTYEELFKI